MVAITTYYQIPIYGILTAATRYPDTGNIYIRKLCHVVCENATKATLYELHLQVTQELKQGSDDQVPAFEGQMDRSV